MYFSLDLLKKVPDEIRMQIDNHLDIYKLFAQGFDPFIFYEFFKLKKNDYQYYFHTTKTDTFFLNFIKHIKESDNKEYLIPALYGHLTHYLLDSNTHPLIDYETKFVKGEHTKLEMELDNYLYKKREKKSYYKYKIHKEINKNKFDKSLIDVLNKTYYDTFNLNDMGLKYQKGVKNMYYAYKFLIKDSTGFKRKIYKFVDKLSKNKKDIYENYSNHSDNIDLTRLNIDNLKWTNPYNRNIKSTKSFFDLYDDAINEGVKLFIETNKYLNNLITLKEYKKVLKDYSYVTHISWKKGSLHE